MNLNEIDVNELVLKLATALFNVLDGEPDHDIKNMTGCNDEEVNQIIEARKIAKEILYEKKFIPLNLDTPNLTSSTPDGWFVNKGEKPLFDGRLVDVRFCNSSITYLGKSPAFWDWTIGSGNNAADIQYWRYSE